MKYKILTLTLFLIALVASLSVDGIAEAQNPDPDICNRAHYYEDWDGTGPYVYCSGMPTNCYCAIVIEG